MLRISLRTMDNVASVRGMEAEKVGIVAHMGMGVVVKVKVCASSLPLASIFYY